MKIYHNDLYINYFKIKKIINLLYRKYYQQSLHKNIKKYVETCNIYQYIKILYYKLYDELASLPISKRVWNFILMNFIMNFSLLSWHDYTYNIIFMIMNQYIKMIRYFLIISIINIPELAELFIDIILKNYNLLISLITNHKFLFTSSY